MEQSRVLVIGLGGVGSWCAEALVRSGIGSITIVDSDTVSETNINRQIQATNRTIGQAKTEALAERLKEINPLCEIKPLHIHFSKASADVLNISEMDYVIDAIDTLSCKLDLIETALAAGKKLFSSMGMARKLDPAKIKTADIWDTSGCPLARLVRSGLRKRNISGHFTAVYSSEQIPGQDEGIERETSNGGGSGKIINGSAVTVTAAAGMVLASLVIRDIHARYAQGQ